MSKTSDLALQLDERAVELGFADHLEALGNGYDWGVNESGEAFLFKQTDEQEKAHEAWLEEKKKVLEGLDYLLRGYPYTLEDAQKVIDAIAFIKRGEC